MSTDEINDSKSGNLIAFAPGSLLQQFPELQTVVDGLPDTRRRIRQVLDQLPDVLVTMPQERRQSTLFPEMVKSLACGDFGGAIGHAWNIAIEDLRHKMRQSDLHLFKENIDESKMKDWEVLATCRSLEMIDAATHFKLKQCLKTRHKFSVAHKAIGHLTVLDCLSFIERTCCFHFKDDNVKAVNFGLLMKAINAGNISSDQLDEFARQIRETFEEQRQLVLVLLYRICCDTSKELTARYAAFQLCAQLKNSFIEQVLADIDSAHQQYRMLGDQSKIESSRWFLVQLGMLGRLPEGERNQIIWNSCVSLDQAHRAYDNWQNEVAPALYLATISSTCAIPAHLMGNYVEVLLTCAVGRPQGASMAAQPYYADMISRLTSDQIRFLATLPESNTTIGQRIQFEPTCQSQFRMVLSWLKSENIPDDVRDKLDPWLNQSG